MSKTKKVAVGLSGGVDSGTTAMILQEEGYEVIGVTMRISDHQDKEIESAKYVANTLGIEHHIVDFRNEFNNIVVKYFKETYELGKTPNPCIKCNKSFKYGRLMDFCKTIGADYFATGHYARKVYDSETNTYRILKAINSRKDQSYNLFQLTQKELEYLIFPIGEFASKEHVRKKSSEKLNIVSSKSDSTGICFIEHKKVGRYLKEVCSSSVIEGNFVDNQGNILGKHKGIAYYTIGQKRKLGEDLSFNYVVTKIDSEKNTVVLGSEENLIVNKLILENTNFLSPNVTLPLDVDIKVSQWSEVYKGKIYTEGDAIAIEFYDPVRAPAPGQAAVFYIGDELVGGGFIS
ncbi:tRNA (5-methylaminomethyl-2-thiouridylate) methyltransferase [Gottschalkia acidurici 9a]|uniref:tRNA-specific 2-thiouridylase MnmA n=1 Tax=Gottschalkia acidurici (strain ATCC 7906 / DSM 604 / BCRC 14475 / CIP 104303 / KCTC 5404 / NCIMB 10678 / 9a) TaxID=1128398 RepID=K0AZR3_GOTA9|nr:tRNA 2-thiouridine(34) synthase MnmA [Gottschalkia acidurici]AFS78210.1 tRNA (5-methylaminomethyl-2-thiouridylate) methyltransferase [Gottschalkia acidurici 9a]